MRIFRFSVFVRILFNYSILFLLTFAGEDRRRRRMLPHPGCGGRLCGLDRRGARRERPLRAAARPRSRQPGHQRCRLEIFELNSILSSIRL